MGTADGNRAPARPGHRTRLVPTLARMQPPHALPPELPTGPPAVRRPAAARVTLLVLYTPRLEECRRFYTGLGLAFTAERHGRGPEHYAAVLSDGAVLELYPARPGRRTDDLRLGLAVDASTAEPPLAPGRHQRVDPDGRTVEIDAV